MDPLLPKLVIHVKSDEPSHRQCRILPTQAAKVVKEEGQRRVTQLRNYLRSPQSKEEDLLWKEQTAETEARRRTGLQSPTTKQLLGQYLITFGKYSHQTFKWLLENDEGYIK